MRLLTSNCQSQQKSKLFLDCKLQTCFSHHGLRQTTPMSIAAVQTVQSTKMHVSSKPAQVNKIEGYCILSAITQYFIRRTPLWTILATCEFGDHQQIHMWSGFPLNKSLRLLICLRDQDKTLRLSSCVKIVMTGLQIEGPWSNTLGIHIRPEKNMH